MIFNSFAYYIIFCSSVLIYGIGFNRESVMCNAPRKVLFGAIKSYICVLLTYLISFLINKMILIPLSIIEIYPFITILIYIIISVFFELLIQITTKRITAEFSVSFLTIILALNEGITLVDGIFICLSCLTSFYLLIPILFALQRRFISASKVNIFKQKSLIFLSMVIIMLALYSFNISWLNVGVIK